MIFPIDLNDDGTYSYNVSRTSLKRFLADVFGKDKYDKLEYNKKFDFDEANASAEDIIKYLASDEKSVCSEQ